MMPISSTAADASPYRQPRPPAPEWRRAGRGLRLVAISTLALFVLGVPIALLHGYLRATMFSGDGNGVQHVLAFQGLGILGMLVWFATSVSTAVGLWRFREVPARTNAARVAGVAFVVWLVAIGVGLAGPILNAAAARSGTPAQFAVIDLAIGTGAVVVNGVYLCAILVAVFRVTDAVGARLSRGVIGVVVVMYVWRMVLRATGALGVDALHHAWLITALVTQAITGTLVALFARFLLRGARIVAAQTSSLP